MQLKIAAQPQKSVHPLCPLTTKEQISEVWVFLILSLDAAAAREEGLQEIQHLILEWGTLLPLTLP